MTTARTATPRRRTSPAALSRATEYYTRGGLSIRRAAEAASVCPTALQRRLAERRLTRTKALAARRAYRERGQRGAAWQERNARIGRLYFGHPYISVAEVARQTGAGYASTWKHVRLYAERMHIPFRTPEERLLDARMHVCLLTRLGFTHRQIAARLGFSLSKVNADRRHLRAAGLDTDALLAPSVRLSLERALAQLGHADAETIAALPAVR